jgi:hypothetical protein
MLIALSVIPARVFAVPSSAFTQADSCQMCHDVFYSQWTRSMHAQAFSDPAYQAALKATSAATHGKLDTYCLRCHVPVGVMAGEVPPIGSKKLSLISQDGVQCDFCHTATGPEPSLAGFGGVAVAPAGPKRGPIKPAPPSPAHSTAFSQIHVDSRFCGMCHDVKHPNGKFLLESTYTEWKSSPYARSGVGCPDCHMVPTPGAKPPFPGKVAVDAPARTDIRSMTFYGANAVIGRSQSAQAMLAQAATLDVRVDKPQAKPGQAVSVRVGITNSGAGHKLPTGLTEVRQMSLDVAATDADGNVIVRHTRMFGTVLADAAGHDHITGKDGKPEPVPLYASASVARDDRIDPKATVYDDTGFKVPMGANGPITVEATLNYRPFPDSIGKAIGVSPVPAVVMAYRSATVSLPAPPISRPVLYGLVAAALVVVIGLATWMFMRWRRARYW